MNVQQGDKVQIINGGMDVTNGAHAKSGKMYGEGGPLWATVDSIITEWGTSGKFGLPQKVTKVRCVSESGTVVWQVQPSDIASNIIKSSKPETVQTEPTPTKQTPEPTSQGKTELNTKDTYEKKMVKEVENSAIRSNSGYAITKDSDTWLSGTPTSAEDFSNISNLSDIKYAKTQVGSTTSLDDKSPIQYSSTGTWRKLNSKEMKSIGRPPIEIDDSVIRPANFTTAWQDPNKRRQLQSEDIENIQNDQGFPVKAKPATGMFAAKYDYQIIPGDPKFPNTSASVEDKLVQVRASFGLPVHGSNEIARATKYYMYNRFKVPDQNLAHSKSFTYVFFTRPDLNLLVGPRGQALYPSQNTLNNTDTAMLWRRHPELFKLLTDSRRCGDRNNFNFLLCNQITSFDIQDENIGTIEAGRSWRDHHIEYGDAYTGRNAGEFSCSFVDTSDYSVINLIKLWMTYIDNVSTGAWSPSYNLNSSSGISKSINGSYVYLKTLDYAASAYVIKCGPDGEDILYWSKYYGVFPINTGASALSWNLEDPVGTVPKLNIRFKYSFKRDLSPVSLIELNSNSMVLNGMYQSSFDKDNNNSYRPFVGAPFVELKLTNPMLVPNGYNYERENTQLRLKFRRIDDARLCDELLYRNTLSSKTNPGYKYQINYNTILV